MRERWKIIRGLSILCWSLLCSVHAHAGDPPPTIEKAPERKPVKIQVLDHINVIIDPSKGIWGLFDDTWLKLSLPLKTSGDVSAYSTNTSLMFPELSEWIGIGGMAQYVQAPGEKLPDTKAYIGTIGPALLFHDITLPGGSKLEGMFMISPALVIRNNTKPSAGIATELEFDSNPHGEGWYIESNTKATFALSDGGFYTEALLGAGYQFAISDVGTRLGMQIKGIYASDPKINLSNGEAKRTGVISLVGQACVGDLLKALHVTE